MQRCNIKTTHRAEDSRHREYITTHDENSLMKISLSYLQWQYYQLICTAGLAATERVFCDGEEITSAVKWRCYEKPRANTPTTYRAICYLGNESYNITGVSIGRYTNTINPHNIIHDVVVGCWLRLLPQAKLIPKRYSRFVHNLLSRRERNRRIFLAGTPRVLP